MTTLLLTAALLTQPPPPPPTGNPETGTTGRQVPDRGPINQPPPMSLDGRWTVVAFERNGQPVADTAGMTMTVRNNVATFGGASGRDTGMMPMRFTAGSLGTVAVTMGDGSGTATAGAGGPTLPPGAAAGTPPAGRMAGTLTGVRTGVMVMTRDYLALSVFDRPAVLPGSTGTPADRAVGGTAPGGQVDPNVRPAGGTDRDTVGSRDRVSAGRAEYPAMVFILRRSDGSR